MDLMDIAFLIWISMLVWSLIEIVLEDIKNNYAKKKNLSEKKFDVDEIEKM